MTRSVVYLAIVGAVTYLGGSHILDGQAITALLGGIAGYAAGRVTNGVKP
jgi:hypothetical protein